MSVGEGWVQPCYPSVDCGSWEGEQVTYAVRLGLCFCEAKSHGLKLVLSQWDGCSLGWDERDCLEREIKNGGGQGRDWYGDKDSVFLAGQVVPEPNRDEKCGTWGMYMENPTTSHAVGNISANIILIVHSHQGLSSIPNNLDTATKRPWCSPSTFHFLAVSGCHLAFHFLALSGCHLPVWLCPAEPSHLMLPGLAVGFCFPSRVSLRKDNPLRERISNFTLSTSLFALDPGKNKAEFVSHLKQF